jgi:hypothetical protein
MMTGRGLPRIIELTEDVQEKISPDILDLKTRPKLIKAGTTGRVEGDIVPGHSIWVNFGRGIGTVAISEQAVKTCNPEDLI